MSLSHSTEFFRCFDTKDTSRPPSDAGRERKKLKKITKPWKISSVDMIGGEWSCSRSISYESHPTFDLRLLIESFDSMDIMADFLLLTKNFDTTLSTTLSVTLKNLSDELVKEFRAFDYD